MESSQLFFVTIFGSKIRAKGYSLIDPPRALHGAIDMSHLRRFGDIYDKGFCTNQRPNAI